MTETTVASGTHAARATFDKSIEVVVGVLVPVGAAVGGFFMPSVLGGGQSVSNALYKTGGNSGSGDNANRIGWGIQALINGAVGAAFWHMRSAGGIILKGIGGAVGGFFIGGALGCLPGIITPSQPPNGLIDKIATGLQGAANGGL